MEIHFCFSLTKDIKINNKTFHFQDFSKENINFIEHLCKLSGVLKSWGEIKTEYNLEEKIFCKWFQLYHAIPNQWKRIIKTANGSCINIVYLSHHSVKNNRIVAFTLHFTNFTQKKFTHLRFLKTWAYLHHNNILKLCFLI